MSDADDFLRAGDLQGARASLVESVKRTPNDEQARMFLFQLFCVLTEWDKAVAQLRVLVQLSPEAQMLASAYGQAIEAEKTRAAVFAGAAAPALLVNTSPWAGDIAAAIGLFAQGKTQDAEQRRDQAFDAAPDTPGEFNGVEFDWIADADARFGPTFEAIIMGKWGLIPFEAVEKITTEGLRDLRDVVWMPVQLAFKTGQSVAAFLPARYPGADTATPNDLLLGRATQWRSGASGEEGVGQRLWSLGGASDADILSLQSLTFA